MVCMHEQGPAGLKDASASTPALVNESDSQLGAKAIDNNDAEEDCNDEEVEDTVMYGRRRKQKVICSKSLFYLLSFYDVLQCRQNRLVTPLWV